MPRHTTQREYEAVREPDIGYHEINRQAERRRRATASRRSESVSVCLKRLQDATRTPMLPATTEYIHCADIISHRASAPIRHARTGTRYKWHDAWRRYLPVTESMNMSPTRRVTSATLYIMRRKQACFSSRTIRYCFIRGAGMRVCRMLRIYIERQRVSPVMISSESCSALITRAEYIILRYAQSQWQREGARRRTDR